MKSVRITEYYDLFNVKVDIDDVSKSVKTTQSEYRKVKGPAEIVDGTTNTFSGFSNWSNFATQNVAPNAYSSTQTQGTADPSLNVQASSIEVTGKYKAPGTVIDVDILANGDILCYPPPISVPYWTKVIFRNYDYQLRRPANTSDFASWFSDVSNNGSYRCNPTYTYVNDDQDITYLPIPQRYWLNKDTTSAWVEPFTGKDFTNVRGFNVPLCDYSSVPVFLKFDLYPSKTKVIFSSVDKTRNPDLEYNFGCQHGSNEPIKLNLSPTCNGAMNGIEAVSGVNHRINYNCNFTRADIEELFSKCYWSIEWVYEPSTGN